MQSLVLGYTFFGGRVQRKTGHPVLALSQVQAASVCGCQPQVPHTDTRFLFGTGEPQTADTVTRPGVTLSGPRGSELNPGLKPSHTHRRPDGTRGQPEEEKVEKGLWVGGGGARFPQRHPSWGEAFGGSLGTWGCAGCWCQALARCPRAGVGPGWALCPSRTLALV